jgi:hypothetical protein
VLSVSVLRAVTENPTPPPELLAQVDLDQVNFVTNDRLAAALKNTTATAEQVEEAVRINMEARLRALKIGLLIMAGLALLAIYPASRLPGYVPGDIPDEPATPQAGPTDVYTPSGSLRLAAATTFTDEDRRQ